MDQKLYIGRSKEIDEVITRIKYQNQSSSILGESGFGKTSLLKYLSDPNILKNFGITTDTYLIIYFNCPSIHQKRDYSFITFWNDIFQVIHSKLTQRELKTIAHELSTSREFDYFTIEHFFYEAKRHGLNIILYLDDFDNLLNNKNFNYEFLWSLKNLANNKIDYNFGLVVASLTRLSILCHDIKLLTSPFFTIFSNITLQPFSVNEGVEFIMQQENIEPVLQYYPLDQLKYMVQLLNGIPVLLYLVSQCMVKKIKPNDIIPGNITDWDDDSKKLINRFIERCWRNSSDDEKRFMIEYAYLTFQFNAVSGNNKNIQKIIKQYSSAWKLLGNRCLTNNADFIMKLFPDMFTQFIFQEILYEPSQIKNIADQTEHIITYININKIKVKEPYHPLIF